MRPQFSTTFGALMALLGMSIGLGNVWRFPYMVSAFGGGAFLLVYFLLLAAFGIPAIMAEFTLGRFTRRGPMGAFSKIGMPGAKIIAWALLVTIVVAGSFYTVVVGWVLRYLIVAATGGLARIDPERLFDGVLAGFGGQFIMTGIVIGLTAAVLVLGVRRGIERVSSLGMPLLFLVLLVLLARTLTLPGAGEGVRFYLVPDFSQIDTGVVAAALGQAFFSLGLGGTFLVTYASYLPSEIDMPKAATTMAVGETLAAVLAGLVIVPAAVACGLALQEGPPLTFVTVPTIIADIPAGGTFATLFFALLFFAAFLSVVAAFEVFVAAATDGFGWTRRRAAFTVCTVVLALAVIPMLSLEYLLKSDLFWGSIMQPLGSVFAVVGLAWMVGQRRALEEINRGAKRPVGVFWSVWIKWVVPAGIIIILAVGAKALFTNFLG